MIPDPCRRARHEFLNKARSKEYKAAKTKNPRIVAAYERQVRARLRRPEAV
jgi:hypothetical protein